jgi:DNA-binding helix-hairpin-helix protein with protein kinase domain
MRYTVDGKTVNLNDTLLLGKGGEKAVYRHPANPALALAVYHKPTLSRVRKLESFLKFGDTFPRDLATIPLLPVLQGSDVVGFGMELVPGHYQEYQALFRKSFCESNGITQEFVSGVALRIGGLLNRIHGIDPRVLIGDLNARAIMFHPTSGAIIAVDVDSWNLPGAPCVVATPNFGCPALFGKDLRVGQNFEQWMDWYSFAVLLINGLLRQHPFIAGIHPTVNDLMGRAMQGITCFDADVTYPKVALSPEILSDDLLNQCIRHLKRADRGPFPLGLLEEYQENLVACGSCGQTYHASRRRCPKCSTVTQVTILMLTLTELLAAGSAEVRVPPA